MGRVPPASGPSATTLPASRAHVDQVVSGLGRFRRLAPDSGSLCKFQALQIVLAYNSVCDRSLIAVQSRKLGDVDATPHIRSRNLFFLSARPPFARSETMLQICSSVLYQLVIAADCSEGSGIRTRNGTHTSGSRERVFVSTSHGTSTCALNAWTCRAICRLASFTSSCAAISPSTRTQMQPGSRVPPDRPPPHLRCPRNRKNRTRNEQVNATVRAIRPPREWSSCHGK